VVNAVGLYIERGRESQGCCSGQKCTRSRSSAEVREYILTSN
jgi:hypothetical protein